ncbi:hypothetical protein ABW20_dc0104242 [Dactylellina cionopaga]|nr:hypothetical protein ABW20_dc0104242 [Dactylellina cionopaga]
MDISVVSSLQSRLAESEDELQRVHSKLKTREEELQQQVTTLKSDLEEAQISRITQEANYARESSQFQSQNQSSNKHTLENFELDARLEELLEVAEKEESSPLPAKLNQLLLLFDHLIGASPIFCREDYTHQWTSALSRMKCRLRTDRDFATVQHERLSNYEQNSALQRTKIKNLLEILSVASELDKEAVPDASNQDVSDPVTQFDDIASSIKSLMHLLQEKDRDAAVLQQSLALGEEETTQYKETIQTLQEQLQSARAKLGTEVKNSEDARTGSTALEDKVRLLEDLIVNLQSELDSCFVKNKGLREEVTMYRKDLDAQKLLVAELQELHTMSQKELNDLIKKEATHAGVIDQLEQQLASTYDQHQDSQKRLLEAEEELRALQSDSASLLASHEAAAHTSAQHIDGLMNELNSLRVRSDIKPRYGF